MSSSPSPSPSSSSNRPYDVFISFRGEDVRLNFFSHLIKELDRKSIKTFKDTEMKKGDSLSPVLTQTIKESRIAVVLISENYASSGWCLNELLEIMKCRKESGQILISIFYNVEPTHVKKQTDLFGKVFESTCVGKSEEMKNQWTKALTEVATVVGYHIIEDRDDEAKIIEKIACDLMHKLTRTRSKDSDDKVGVEDHIAKLSVMLDLGFESEKVMKVGIWGPSGIGKTTIASALYSQHSHNFNAFISLDVSFITKSTKGNLHDYNTQLYLQEIFLSKILNQKDIKVDHLGVVEERLKHQKVLIVLDDVENQVVLDTLIGGEWFGPGSRIIVITKDKRLLEAHGGYHIYKVSFPSEMQALEIFCQSAFGQKSPPDGYMELATEVAARAGGLPLGLSILGKTMKNRTVKDWKKELPMLRETLNGSIQGTLRLSYYRLDTEAEKAIFRQIACFFNGVETNSIMLMLPYKELVVERVLEHLVEKSLISVKRSWNNTDMVDMHCLVQEMGKQLVRAQSDDPGEREFLFDSEDVCNVLENSTGTGKVLGISLDMNEIDESTYLNENAFKGMCNLRYLRFYTNSWEEKKEVEWNLPERFEDFPPKLKLLSWPGYPMEDMPSKFRPENLVELRMPKSKILKRLWKGDKSLKHLKIMDLSECQNLTNIPDLSKATNLETLDIHGCSSLVELPSSIMSLHKLTDLNTEDCTKLEDLPTGDLESLIRLNLAGCSQLKKFPDISNNISELNMNKTAIEIFPHQLRLENLVELSMEHIMSERLWEGAQRLTKLKTIKLSGSSNLKEIPDLSMATSLETLNLNNCSSLRELTLSSIQNLNKLTSLEMLGCSSLETLPSGINLESLHRLNLNDCSRLTSFPDISSNITILFLNQTAVEEVPPWIENLSNLEALEMRGCRKLKSISPRMFELETLDEVFFSDCEKLADVTWPEKAEDTSINTRTNISVISFINCFNLNQETFIQRAVSKCLVLPGEVPPYFTHRASDSCFIIPLHQSSIAQQSFLDFKVCLVVSDLDVVSKRSNTVDHETCYVDIEVRCRFRDKHGNYSEPTTHEELSLHQRYNHLIIFECHIPLQPECDQVEIQFHLPNKDLKLNRCDMRLSDDCTPISADQNEASYKYDESIADNDGGYTTTLHEEECGDNSDDEGYETALDEEECCCDIVLTEL